MAQKEPEICPVCKAEIVGCAYRVAGTVGWRNIYVHPACYEQRHTLRIADAAVRIVGEEWDPWSRLLAT